MKKQRLKKILLAIVVSLEIVFLNAAPVGAISIPSPSRAARQAAAALEERYHLNLSEIQEQSEGFNVANTKKIAPQVMLFFNPEDPKAGEKISAEALPMYFSNPSENLYFTWFLKHKDNNKDLDGDGNVDINDYKVEAMRVIANGGADTADFGSTDNDDDGYKARFGGNDKVKTNDYCYIHDFKTGIDYELSGNGGAGSTFLCDGSWVSGDRVGCIEDDSLDCVEGDGSTNSYNLCSRASSPTCDNGTISCASGSPRCVDVGFTFPFDDYDCDSQPAGNLLCSSFSEVANTPTSCETGISGGNGCVHLFPCAENSDHEDECGGESVGDNGFGKGEENFWRTNPQDSDTADNGNKDEANAAGLGDSRFTWTYQEGDRVGVVVEGTSMIPTKHDDSSMMIMWAFPKNNCEPEGTNSYTQSIKGYDVDIPTADMDLNDCLENNLIDPRQGQVSKLEVALNYSPENPINDPSGDEEGDTLVTHASASNASKEISQLKYTWTVKASDTMTLDESEWDKNIITDDLVTDKLITGPVVGNGIDSLNIRLNMPAGNPYDSFNNGVGYLRIYVKVQEIFDTGDVRTGRSDVIVKVISTDKKISAYNVTYNTANKLGITGNAICSQDVQKFTCFVLKNDIVGVQVSGTGMENFYWTLNGKPLNCTSSISNACNDTEQININFFPVIGDLGEKYTLDLTATDISTAKTIHLVRVFQVIDPFVEIVSTNEDSVWPMFLGDYVNVNDGSLNHDFSKSAFQTFSGNGADLKAEFHPQWLINNKTTNPLSGGLMFEWLVDGEKIAAAPDNQENINFPIAKEPGDVYNVTLNAVYYHSQQVRQALQDIWQISQFDSPETYMSAPIQIEIVENEPIGMKNNPKNFLANLASHIPGQVMFMLRILLTIFVILITTSVVFSFMPSPKISRYE